MAKIRSSRPSTLAMLESPVINADLRPYLGMSQLGHDCNRFIWLQFRWAFKDTFSSRMGRLFKRGHREEVEIEKELAKIGITCGETQTEMVAGFGHMKGHNDGVLIGVPEAPKTPHNAEYKTMNDKWFKDLCKHGSVKVAQPKYYAQSVLYMHFLKLTRTLFVAVNKNDDSYYVERLKEDKVFALDLNRKGENIILSELPPPKVFKATWWKCKFCAARGICHFGKAWETNCRTCVHCSPELDGKWACSLGEDGLSLKRQRIGCTEHQSIGV